MQYVIHIDGNPCHGKSNSFSQALGSLALAFHAGIKTAEIRRIYPDSREPVTVLSLSAFGMGTRSLDDLLAEKGEW